MMGTAEFDDADGFPVPEDYEVSGTVTPDVPMVPHSEKITSNGGKLRIP